jgi:Zn-finger nucleic acid-binding protein
MGYDPPMNLTCVKCTSVLDRSKIGDVEVDLCPACGGLWLDHGEIERLGKLPSGPVDTLKKALTGGAPAGLSDTATSCPACPGALKEVKLGPVHIDYCGKCKGVFLDKGELDMALSLVDGSTVEEMLAVAASTST